MKSKFVRYGNKVAAVVGSVMLPVAAFAQSSGSSDPTSTISSQLATYLTDVGTLAAAVLLIFYGKKLVSFLKV
jgi:type IV secretory pathway VirB2 component (pilin)